MPAGTIAGLAVIGSYVLSGRRYGVPVEQFATRCEVTGPGGAAVDLACVQPSTGATITLLVVFFWILVVLARPFLLWKAALIGVMVLLAVLAFVLPVGRDFFSFSAPMTLVWQSLGIGLVGAAFIEGLHRWAAARR